MTKELIESAIEELMNLRIKSENEQINEKHLYDVQGILYKSLDSLQSENERLKAEMELEIINFATWYSCESEGTVKSAYKRYKKLSPPKQ